jgi:8-oxo-dGTP diphosphatase
MEEVGLQVEVGDLLDVFEHVTPGEDNYHFIILYYLCRPLSCDIVHNADEVDDSRWISQDEVKDYKMPDGSRFILRKVFPLLERRK